jgi:hypothetical protein
MDVKGASRYGREIDEFFTKIHELGYRQRDFTVRCLEWPLTNKPASAGSDLIIVKRTSNGVELAYAANTNEKWLQSFIDDLHSGIFDLPVVRAFPTTKPEHESEPQI